MVDVGTGLESGATETCTTVSMVGLQVLYSELSAGRSRSEPCAPEAARLPSFQQWQHLHQAVGADNTDHLRLRRPGRAGVVGHVEAVTLAQGLEADA